MASSTSPLLVVLVLMLISLAKAQIPTTIAEFYLQDLASGTNATVQPITGIRNRPMSFTSFGTIFAIDDPITVSPDRSSTEIGRAQGIMVVSSLSGYNVHVALSFGFNNGSSLEIQGTSRQLERYKELGVVSGTGTFRYARGYATLERAFTMMIELPIPSFVALLGSLGPERRERTSSQKASAKVIFAKFVMHVVLGLAVF